MENTGRSSILCPNCRKLISSDEPRCPYCGTAHPGSRWKNNPWTRGINSPDQLINGIIVVNVIMFVLSLLLNPSLTGLSLNPFTFLSPDNSSLLLLGATGTIPIGRFDRWWSLISATYLHGGILHILFNMMALRQIGPLIIREYGPYRMVVLYTAGGVLGYVASYVAGVRFTIGASAAVCGLIGAALYYGKSRGGAYGQVIYSQVGSWAVSLFIFGFLVPGINNWAHGGGMLAGGLFGMLLGDKERKPESLVDKGFAGICVTATLAILGWAIASALFYRVMG